jgi:hypothetical protein
VQAPAGRYGDISNGDAEAAMALAEIPVNQPEKGEPPDAGPPGARVRSPWRRRPLAIGVIGSVVAAFVVLAVLAGTYQPVQFGSSYGGAYPGMPAGVGIHAVNTFGEQVGQTLIPPQHGAFTLTVSIDNAGPRAVTIEAVSFQSPQRAGLSAWPLIAAGSVHWMLEGYPPHVRPGPYSGTSVTGLSLSPHEAVRLGIPVRMPSCFLTGAWTTIDAFYVQVRFLGFTHWVPIELPSALLMPEPASPGVPAKDLTCPK